MCTQSIRREIVSTPWAIVPKDPKFKDDPSEDIQREIDYVTFFLNSCNPNKESIESIISMCVQDLLELDAGAIVKGFDDQSYNKTPAGGLELLPSGERNLVEIWSRDGGSFLKETDVNGEIYRFWQYSYLHPCLAVGSIINTNPSITTVQELATIKSHEKADRVLSHNGKYYSVTDNRPHEFHGLLYLIKPIGVPTLRVTPNHQFCVLNKKNEEEWINADLIGIKDRLVVPIPTETANLESFPLIPTDSEIRSKVAKYKEAHIVYEKLRDYKATALAIKEPISTVYHWLRDKQIVMGLEAIDRVVKVNDDFLELMGYYLSEGSLGARLSRITFTVGAQEKWLQTRIKQLMQTVFKIETCTETQVENGYHLDFYDKYVGMFFERNFYYAKPRRAHNKRIPQWLMFLPAEKQLFLIRGMWEGDGCVNKRSFSFKTASEKLAWQMWMLLLRQKLYGSIAYNKPSLSEIKGRTITSKGSYDVHVTGHFLEPMSKLLGEDHPRLHERDREYSRVELDEANNRFIVDIYKITTERYDGLVYDVEVDETHTFCVNGILTHNSVAPIEFDINEICYFSQYPRSYSVYGWSPLQSMDNVLSSLINSAAWNSTFFSEATLPSGIIGVQNMNPEELERFRQYFRTEIKGRWHRIAVVNSDVNYVPFALTNRDMQWLDGQRWYAKLVMAMYNITPTELGFTDDVRATGKAMGAQEEVQKRKSTMPILRLVEQIINNNVVSELSENVMFQFKPSDRTEELMQVDVDNKDLDLGKQTVNDIIKKRGLGVQKWWGDEPLNLILERIKRGEPIPPIQLPKQENAAQPQQTPVVQRSFNRVIRKGYEDLDFQRAFNIITNSWPPINNPLTGHAHTQDDTLPHTQDDETIELSKAFQKEISGNRIGNGKEQRDDYLGSAPETIPGANERGELPTAVGLKPHSFDGRDGMLNASDVGHGYPAKGFSNPGLTGSTRLGSSAGDYENKPYDDTIDPKARRNIPKDNANTYTNRLVPDGPDGSYGQHPWEEDPNQGGLMHGYRTGIDQSQNPAYQGKQVQPSSGLSAGWEMQAAPPMQVETPEYQQLYKKVLEKNPDLTQERLEQMVQETLRDSERYQEMFQEEKQEHPSFTDEQIDQIVIDHFKAQKKDFVATLPLNNSPLQNLQTNPQHQSSPDQEKGEPYDPEWGVPQTITNPIMHAGPHDTLDEHRLDKLRQSPASTNETATGPGPSGKYVNAGPGDDGRQLIEGSEQSDDIDTTRKAKSEVPATGFLRDPISEPDLSQHIPSHYRDQQGVSQFLDKEHDTNLVPHPDILGQKNAYNLDLSGTLQDQIERFGKFTDTTGVEFGALVVRRQNQIVLDQVQVGENHEINIQPTAPMEQGESILGTYHQHPNSLEFSVWDCLSFLSSQWEQVSILRAADGNIVVMLKQPQTKLINADPETLRNQYQGYSNEQMGQEFGFAVYRGSSNDLQEIV